MSARLYLKDGVTPEQEPEAIFKGYEKPYLWLMYIFFKDIHNLRVSGMKNVEYITIEETFWRGLNGYNFVPGYYEGNGFKVRISPSCESVRGNNNKGKGVLDWRQEVSGRFNSAEIASAFWDALTLGKILPTAPLCRQLNATEQVYAKQAADGVAAMARLGEVEVRLAHLEQIHMTQKGWVSLFRK